MDAPKPAKSVLGGAKYVLTGAKLITKPRLRRFVLLPLTINIAVFALGIFALSHTVDWVLTYLPGWLQWLKMAALAAVCPGLDGNRVLHVFNYCESDCEPVQRILVRRGRAIFN